MHRIAAEDRNPKGGEKMGSASIPRKRIPFQTGSVWATRQVPLLAGLALMVCLVPAALAQTRSVEEKVARPNIVMIVIDDAALMDLGAYGGEARTPNIDRLAARGTLFTRYRTSPLCAPSRAMLLTGLDNHLTGVATIPEILPAELEGKPGYSLSLEPGVTTIAARLKEAGYRTYITGKWHLGHGQGDLPDGHGFDRSFVLDASGADNWEQKPYMPYYTSADWFEDGRPVRLPKPFYSSTFIVDQMVSYLAADQNEEAPFFAYLAFLAIHIPVQAPAEVTARYEGAFDAGWDVMRQARFERAKALGLIPESAGLAPAPASLRPWDGLSAKDRALYAKSMAVQAAMLETMDTEIGRLITELETNGQFENTIFVVTSDNGPEPTHPIGEPGFTQWMALNGYDHNLETLGERGSMVFIGPEWAFATASPSDLFKFYTTEGGLRVPLIMAGPGVPSGARRDGMAFVTDITPTLLDLVGVESPADAFSGRSLTGLLSAEQVPAYGPQDPVGIEVSGNAALYKGDWKLVRNRPPWGDGQWKLFNLATDPGETQDLAEQEPDRLTAMKADYAAFEARNGVLPMAEGYDIHQQISINAQKKQLAHNGWRLVFLALSLIAFSVAMVILWRRRRLKHKEKQG
jgi:arylsulfatase A-like enzyme